MKNDWSMVENSQKSLQKKIRYVKQIKEFLDNSDNYKEGEAPDFRTGKIVNISEAKDSVLNRISSNLEKLFSLCSSPTDRRKIFNKLSEVKKELDKRLNNQ